jgi:hypothetical protein
MHREEDMVSDIAVSDKGDPQIASRNAQQRGIRFERICTLLLGILFTVLFAVLLYISLKGTYSDNQQSEQLFFHDDFLPWHVLACFLFLTLFAFVAKITGRISGRIMLAAFMAGIVWIGCIWVHNIHTMPQVDQLYISMIADAFNKGDFSALQAGGYASKCRQQLGIITFFRMFFVFFGEKNTGAFEYFNVLCAALIYLGGYGIVGCLSKRVQAQKIFLVLAFLVFPILFYTPFVYGELFSTALVLLGLWALLSALQKFTWKKGIAAALLIGYAIQIRQNALIVLIALTICLLIRAISAKSRQILLLAGSIVLSALVLQGITGALYARYIPSDSKPMPSVLYVAMGITDNDLGPGWNNGYNWDTFSNAGNDPAAASAAAKGLIRERLSFFKSSPGAAVTFFYKKFSTQWNDPMFQSLASSNFYWSPPEDMDYEVLFGAQRQPVYDFSNYLQSFIYFCMLLYVLRGLKRKNRIETCMIPLSILGGALFSLLWEAKSRYMFPWYVMMLPCAAALIDELLQVYYQNAMSQQEGGGTAADAGKK